MAIEAELKRVRRSTGGRVHLAAHVPEAGPVTTLCGAELAAGAYRPVGDEADCRSCLRRRDDPARVSSAFFQGGAGAELLQLSLRQAAERRARREAAPAPSAPAPSARPARAAPRPPPAPPAIRELRSATPLRRTFENVYTSPAGVVLRLGPDGELREVAFSGPVDLRRREGTITLRAGDVVLEFD